MYALALTLCLMADGQQVCRHESVYTNDCVGATRAIRAHNPAEAKVTELSCARMGPDFVLPDGHPVEGEQSA